MPRGRVIEIFGPESSGKTTLALQVIAEAQKLGGMAAFVDAEHALDALYASKLGVDIDNLLVSQPDNGEQALEIVEGPHPLERCGRSSRGLGGGPRPKAEIEGEMGDAQMGLQARLMSAALRKLTGAVSKSKTSLIFINQLREENRGHVRQPRNNDRRPRAEILCVGSHGQPPHRQHQGRRRRHRWPRPRQGGQEQGGAALREAEFDVMYGEGISKTGDLLDLCRVEKRIVEKSGAWFAYGGERLGQGRENAKQFLKDNPEVFKAIDDKVRRELGMSRDAVEPRRGCNKARIIARG